MIKTFRYIQMVYGVLTKVPSFGILIVLQLLSGVTSFIGLPLLIPVMSFVTKGTLSENKEPILDTISSILGVFGITVTLPILLTVVLILVMGGILLNSVVILWASFSQYDLFASGTKKLIQGYMHVQWPWVVRNNTGQINHALYNETAIQANAIFLSLKLTTTLIQVIVFSLLSFYISWQISLVGSIVVGFVMIVNLMAARKVKNASAVKNEEQKVFSVLVQSIQQNRKFLKSSILHRSIIPRVEDSVEKLVRLAKEMAIWDQIQPAWSQGVIFLFFILLIAKHSLFSINLEELFVLLLVIMRLLPLITGFSSIYSSFSAYLPVYESLESRFMELDKHKESFGNRPYVDGSLIKMERVCFSYDQKRPVLKDIKLEIPKHSTIAIVGSSGEGKTSILDILLGLWSPDQGVIWYGDIPHKELDYYSLRKRIAYVSQETTLFPGTLKENLLIGAPDCAEERIGEVCQIVYLDQLLKMLPDGLDTVIGENGVMLSGGQRQRVALGRALIMNPDILILDEATNALDSESEQMIQEAIKGLHGKQTTLIVTHRISTVKDADCIYVLDRGQVANYGTYDELVQSGGKFSQLLSSQSHGA